MSKNRWTDQLTSPSRRRRTRRALCAIAGRRRRSSTTARCCCRWRRGRCTRSSPAPPKPCKKINYRNSTQTKHEFFILGVDALDGDVLLLALGHVVGEHGVEVWNRWRQHDPVRRETLLLHLKTQIYSKNLNKFKRSKKNFKPKKFLNSFEYQNGFYLI